MFAWVNVLFLSFPKLHMGNLSFGHRGPSNPTNVDGAELRRVMLFA